MTGLLLSLAPDARVAAQHAETTSFATGRAIKPVAHHAAVLLIADRLAGNASFVVALAVELVARHAAILRAAGCNQVLAQSPCHIINVRDIV